MLYRVPGHLKNGYDFGAGTYGGYVRWVRTLDTGTVRVRYGYDTWVRYTRILERVPAAQPLPDHDDPALDGEENLEITCCPATLNSPPKLIEATCKSM